MIMELVEGTLLKNTTNNESIYNKVLEAAEILVDNGIQNRDMNGGNIIIQNDGSIKVIDYGEAYEISNLSDSKKKKLIIKMARYAKPHDDSENSLTDEMSIRLANKLSLLNQGKGKKKLKRSNKKNNIFSKRKKFPRSSKARPFIRKSNTSGKKTRKKRKKML